MPTVLESIMALRPIVVVQSVIKATYSPLKQESETESC